MTIEIKRKSNVSVEQLAKYIVMDQARALGNDSNFEVKLVWFCYILGGWKALCTTTRDDDRYYEVTFNKEKSEAYVDTYRKTHNIVVDIT